MVFTNVTLTDEKVEWAPELGMITLNTTVALPEADDQGVALCHGIQDAVNTRI